MSSVGFIWDIDGVIVDSPHEEAWRAIAAKEPWNVKDFSSDFYFTHVASRPRYEGGNNILALKGVYERMGAGSEEKKKELLERYCSEKDRLIKELIQAGEFKLFPDAVTMLLEAKKRGLFQAAASASKNAKAMLNQVTRSRAVDEIGEAAGIMNEDDTLYCVFDVDACGLDLGGKRNLLEFAARELNKSSRGKISRFIVFEDAPSGIEAASSLGYYSVGAFRIGDKDALEKAGADIVTEDLLTIEIEKLLEI